MSDWFGPSSTDNGSSGMSDFAGGWETPSPVQQRPSKKGGWHVLLTLAALVFTVAASFGMAFATRNQDQRSAVMLGLTFGAIALAIMLATLLVESLTSSMVPRYSRKGQLGVALATVLCCFIVGCFGESVSGFTKPQPTPTPVVTATPSPTPNVEPVSVNYVILLDKSGSMSGPRNNESVNAALKFINGLPDGTYVGVIPFTHQILGVSPISALNSSSRLQHQNMINIGTSGGTDFDIAVEAALKEIEKAKLPAGSETLILMITDASDDLYSSDVNTLTKRFQKNNAHLCCLVIDYSLSGNIAQLVQNTGGKIYTINDVSKIHQNLVVASQIIATPSPTATPAPTPTPEPIVVTDVIRQAGSVQEDEDDEINWVSMVMMILEGLIIGISLTLMTSRYRQRRFQPILSTLMGVAAGLILNYVHLGTLSVWVQEAIAFSCYGVVIMSKNQ